MTITYDMLKKDLKAGKLSDIRLFYVYGADIVSIDKAVAKLVSTFSDKATSDMNLTRFTSSDMNMPDVEEALIRLPFFSDYSVVVLNDFNADSFAAGVFPKFSKLLSDLPKSTVLIISITGFDVCCGKKAPVKNNKKLIDTFSKSGCVCECKPKTASGIADDILAYVKKNGSEISRTNAIYLAERCLCETQLVASELGKLCSFAYGDEITREVIDKLVIRHFESDVFAISAAIISRNAIKALHLLDDVFAQRSEEIAVVAALSNSFVELYRAKLAIAAGKTADDVAADFSMGARSFVVIRHFQSCRSASRDQLRYCIDILTTTDLKLKSTQLNKRVLVEKAVTEMLRCHS